MWIIPAVRKLGCRVLHKSFVSFVSSRHHGCTGWPGVRTGIQLTSAASGAWNSKAWGSTSKLVAARFDASMFRYTGADVEIRIETGDPIYFWL